MFILMNICLGIDQPAGCWTIMLLTLQVLAFFLHLFFSIVFGSHFNYLYAISVMVLTASCR